MNTLELDQQLNAMIVDGKSGDAFRTFYAEDVVAQENDVEIEGMGAMKIIQVAVRRWKDGKVARERFYHK